VLASACSSPKGADLLNAAIKAAVIAAVVILLARFMNGRFDENERRWEANDRRWEANDGRLGRIEAKLEAHDTRFDALDGRMESFERSLDAVRSDLTRVALAVEAGPSAEAGAGP
jgi:hypothetical protein